MTKMMRRLEAERRRSWFNFRMRGTVTKRHFFSVAKTFGIRKAFALLFSTNGTALTVLMS